MKFKLIMVFIFCIKSLIVTCQETKLYPQRTVYYKTGKENELIYINSEDYEKQLTFFQYNESYMSLDFYLGEYRFKYSFNFDYVDNTNSDEEVSYWRSEKDDALLIFETNSITVYSFKDKWAVVYHMIKE